MQRYKNNFSRAFFPRVLAAFIGLLGGFVLLGCETTVVVRGNLPPESKLAQVETGRSDRQQVIQALGSPSAAAAFDARVWYYISERREGYGPLDLEITDYRVLELTFDEAGILADIKNYTLDDKKNIVYSADETPTAGRSFSFFEQLFGNLGTRPVDQGAGTDF